MAVITRAGLLRTRLEHQTFTESTTAKYGEPTKTWSRNRDVWADVVPLSGREALIGDQIVADMTHRITVRYDRQVRVNDRYVDNQQSVTYGVLAIRDIDNRRIRLELQCKVLPDTR